MRAVLTRVSEATVTVDGETVGAIDCPETGGLLRSSWRLARGYA